MKIKRQEKINFFGFMEKSEMIRSVLTHPYFTMHFSVGQRCRQKSIQSAFSGQLVQVEERVLVGLDLYAAPEKGWRTGR